MPKSFTFVVCVDALSLYDHAILSLVCNDHATRRGTLPVALIFLPELCRGVELRVHVI